MDAAGATDRLLHRPRQRFADAPVAWFVNTSHILEEELHPGAEKGSIFWAKSQL